MAFFVPPATRSHDVPSDVELDQVNALMTLYIRARDHRRNRYDSWVRNYRLVNNRITGQGSQSWLPSPRDSEVYPACSGLVAWLTDQEPAFDFAPAMDPHGQLAGYINELASDLNNVMYTTWLMEKYDYQTKLALWDGVTFGLGIVKTLWDNEAAGGLGNAVLRRVDPWSWYPDPYATSLHDLNYCVEARRVSWEELERRFPDEAHLVRPGSSGATYGIDERPAQMQDSVRGAIPLNLGALPSGNALWGRPRPGRQNPELSPNHILYEVWTRENDVWFDPHEERHVSSRWRLWVVCEGRILFSEYADELWHHGQHPYDLWRFEDIGEMYGVSLVDHLAYPQIYINRLLTAMQANAELTGNPVFLEPSNSGLARTMIINKPGQRLPVNANQAAGANLPRWLEPPPMPQQVLDLIRFWIDRIENVTGLSAMQKGRAPNQRNSQQVISSVQEAAFVRIRSALTNLQYTLRDAVTKAADLIVENYTEPRFMACLGPEGQKTALALAGRHFYGPANMSDPYANKDDKSAPIRFSLRVEAGASTPTSRAARFDEARQLLALQAVDDQYVLETARVRNPEKILARLYKKRQMGVIGTGPGTRQRQGRNQ